MVDARVSGVPIFVIICATVTNDRLYMVTCLRAGEAPDVARLITAEIRPGRGRLVLLYSVPAGLADGVDSRNENPQVRTRTILPAFEFKIQ